MGSSHVKALGRGERSGSTPEQARSLPTSRRGHRQITKGTIVARLMSERGLKRRHLSFVLQCSERHLTRFFKREYPVPVARLPYLEEMFDMDAEELVDEAGFLRLDDEEDG